jgi:protein phosphatase
MQLRAGMRTDKGCVRDLNEDVYAVRPKLGLFVVCDGMGGCPAGEVASDMAVTAILDDLTTGPRTIANGTPTPGYLPRTNRLADAVRRSNNFVYREAQRDPRQAQMGTTVVSAWIDEHIASVAHIGDSRAYLWHDDRLTRLTRDHSLAETSTPIADQATIHGPLDQQNVLLRVLGREPDVDVDLAEVPVQAGDYVLLCSDGLTRMVPDETIAKTISRIRDVQLICDSLVDAAIRNGGLDNVTVVVAEVSGNWWQRMSAQWKGRRWRS